MSAALPQQTARQRLGELITHYLDERQLTDNRVSRTCSASERDVDAWKRGELVPSSEQWSKLKRACNHALGRFAELYQCARKEADDEARARAARTPMRHDTRINSALGEQLSTVRITERTPPPPKVASVLAAVPDPPQQKEPPAQKNHGNLHRRMEHAKRILRTRPSINVSGKDGLSEEMLRVFGIGISGDTVRELRKAIAVETAPVTPEPPPAKAPPTPTKAADLQAAVDLILAAVPNLSSLTIVVDESGEASADYKVREQVVEVRETAGSLKARRAES
ncbi:MAG TPA: hypothetical protein VGM39_10750 [Kofleriaceae bacterium]